MASRKKAVGSLASLMEPDSEPDFDSFDNNTDLGPPTLVTRPRTTRARARLGATGNNSIPTARTRHVRGRGAAKPRISRRCALHDTNNSDTQSALQRAGKNLLNEDAHNLFHTDIEGPEPPIARSSRLGTGNRETDDSAGPPITVIKKKCRDRSALKRDVALLEEVPVSQGLDDIATGRVSDDLLGSETISMHSAEASLVKESPDFIMSDPSPSRLLEDLKKKYRSLELRYCDLQNLGIRAAERNFEQLQEQAKKNAATANDLISQLKHELAALSERVRQGDEWGQKLQASNTEVEVLGIQLSHLKTELCEAKREVAKLSTKLEASRNAEIGSWAPGSALKTAGASNRATLSDSIQAARAAQSKQDLYSDLTGLILRDLKRNGQEDVFDCIQTGRNGTLHFKLAAEKTEKADSYDDVQFSYRPQLDTNRDRDLMGMLPDYLTEEITFPRLHASKFYTRVTKALMERSD